MTRELAAEFIGVSGPTFDKYYRYEHNFPVVKNGDVEEAFPRTQSLNGLRIIGNYWKKKEKEIEYSTRKHLIFPRSAFLYS